MVIIMCISRVFVTLYDHTQANVLSDLPANRPSCKHARLALISSLYNVGSETKIYAGYCLRFNSNKCVVS